MALPYYNSPPRFALHPAYGYGSGIGPGSNTGNSLLGGASCIYTNDTLLGRGSFMGYNNAKQSPMPGLIVGSAGVKNQTIVTPSNVHDCPPGPCLPSFAAPPSASSYSSYRGYDGMYGMYQQPTSAMRSQVLSTGGVPVNNVAGGTSRAHLHAPGYVAGPPPSQLVAAPNAIGDQQQYANSSVLPATGGYAPPLAPPQTQSGHSSFTANGTTYFVPSHAGAVAPISAATGPYSRSGQVGLPLAHAHAAPVQVPVPVATAAAYGTVVPPQLYAPMPPVAALPVVNRSKSVQDASDDNCTGGISSRLDYSIEDMAEFYANMSYGIMVPRNSDTKRVARCKESLVQVFTATRLPKCTLLLALVYLSKRWNVKTQRAQTPVTPGGRFSDDHAAVDDDTVYRMIVVSLLLANKVHDDHTFTNKSWHEATGIEVRLLTATETEWLKAIRWSLFLHAEDQTAWRQWDGCWTTFMNNKNEEHDKRGSFDPALSFSPSSSCTTPTTPRSPYAPATPVSPTSLYGTGFTVPNWYKTASSTALSPCPAPGRNNHRPYACTSLPPPPPPQQPAFAAPGLATSVLTSQQGPGVANSTTYTQAPPSGNFEDPHHPFVSYFQQSFTCVAAPPGYGNESNKGYYSWYPTSSSVMAC